MADEVLDETYNPQFRPELMTPIQGACCEGETRCRAKVVVREGGRWLCQRHKTQRVIPEDRQCTMEARDPSGCHNFATVWLRGSHFCRFHKRDMVKFLLANGANLTAEEIHSDS